MTVVTPNDRPKSVSIVLVAFLCCPLVFEFSIGIGDFVIGLSQISFFFSLCWRHNALTPEAIPAIKRNGRLEYCIWQYVIQITFIMIFEYRQSYNCCPKLRLTSCYVFKKTTGKRKKRKKERDLTQFYGKNPYAELSNVQSDNKTTPPKSSITQRLPADLGRSVGITSVTQLVWLTSLRAQPSHSP